MGRAGAMPPRHLSTRTHREASSWSRSAAGDGFRACLASRKANPRHCPVSAATCSRRSARSSALAGQQSTAAQAEERIERPGARRPRPAAKARQSRHRPSLAHAPNTAVRSGSRAVVPGSVVPTSEAPPTAPRRHAQTEGSASSRVAAEGFAALPGQLRDRDGVRGREAHGVPDALPVPARGQADVL